MNFQVIFGMSTAACMFYFLVMTRNSVRQRLFVLGFFGSGLALIINPEITNRIAHYLGIGRGADLIFYLSTLFLFFLCFNLYMRMKTYQAMMTEVTRQLALLRPIKEAPRSAASD
jgi:hypothetical protein